MRPIIFVRVITITIVLTIIALSLFLVMKRAEKTELPFYSTLPDFEFVTQDSIPFDINGFYGKISVVDFMFTRCKGPCPVMVVNMGDLYKEFERDSNIQFISISVDPDFDSLSVLREYAESHGVTDDRWQFLSADMESVVALCEDGFKLAAEDLPGSHSTKFILVDELANIRGYYSGIEGEAMNKLKTDIIGLTR